MSFNILVVDDSPLARKIVQRTVAMAGIEVGELLEAANGVEALQLLEQHWVDLVFADINMPEMDGDALVARMRESEVLREVPVLVITSDRSEARMARLRELGVSAYLTKPLTPEAVRDAVGAVLGKGAGN